MKLRCTNRDKRVIVLGFVGADDSLLAAVSFSPDALDAEMAVDAKEGDEYRLVKIKQRKPRAKPKPKPKPKKTPPAPEQGGTIRNVRKSK